MVCGTWHASGVEFLVEQRTLQCVFEPRASNICACANVFTPCPSLTRESTLPVIETFGRNTMWKTLANQSKMKLMMTWLVYSSTLSYLMCERDVA